MLSAIKLAVLCTGLVLAAVSTGHAEGPGTAGAPGAVDRPTSQQRGSEPEHNRQRRDEEARALFAAGKSAFEDGRFEDALVEFKRAHQRSGRPELLYNIGLAAMELGQNEEALAALQGFVAAVPENNGVETARLRIELLEKRIAEGAASQPTPAEATAIDPPNTAPVVPRARVQRPYTWLAGGISLALGATALGVGLKAQNDYRDLREECQVAGQGTCSQARVDDAGLSQRALATNVLAVGAGVALAVSVALFFYEGRGRGDTKLAARVGPSSVSLLGSF